MGAATAGANMGKTPEEGQKLLDNFFGGFPYLKKAIEDSKEFLRKNGYVEDFLGRRRRLPEINLEPYTVELKNNKDDMTFNPILGCNDHEYIDPLVIKWQNEIKNAIDTANLVRRRYANPDEVFVEKKELSNKKFDELAKAALKDGVILHANTGRIAQAERQCFNARIQGSAASLTKLAMIDIFNDPVLRQCNTKLIIPVHDELLVECPEEYADIVEKRLPEVMINAAKRGGDDVPQACDPYNVSRWYCDTAGAFMQEEFKKLEQHGKTRDEALAEVIKNHSEVPDFAIIKTIETGCDLEF